MAMKAGASGVLGGRAFWKEFFTYADPGRAAEVRRDRVRPAGEGDRRDREDRRRRGSPSTGCTMEDLHGMRATEGWHARYGGGTAPAGGAAPVDKDAVY